MKKCFSFYCECEKLIPDKLNETGEVLYWKIDCVDKDACFKDWYAFGGRLGWEDIKDKK